VFECVFSGQRWQMIRSKLKWEDWFWSLIFHQVLRDQEEKWGKAKCRGLSIEISKYRDLNGISYGVKSKDTN
jgi:hypothetical protein